MFWTAFILFSLTCRLAACDGTPVVGSNLAYRSVAYYANWAIYDRKFNPQDLPVENLTHVLYAFANINPDTGEVYLSDTWADTDIHFPDDSSSETGTNLYGCLKQFYLMKKKNRHLKVLLSIGGSSYSSNFATPVSNISGRSTFASTAIALVKNLGLDGLDIDWEYPADHTEAANMVLLLQNVREALDAYGDSLTPPYHFQLTVACPAGPLNYRTMNLADMNKHVDFWNLMAWDYAGPWSALTAHQANMFKSASKPATTPFDTQTAIEYYISQGISSDKLVLGIPVYGRSFSATDGLGNPFNGVGKGTWEAGVYDFKDLPLRGAVENYDNASGSSYSYDATTKELISYDTIMVAKQKATWIQQMKLGGVMWWEGSADGVGDKSLIQNTIKVLGGEDGDGLETDSNELIYPNSTYDNLRAGMPNSVQPHQCNTTSNITATRIYPLPFCTPQPKANLSLALCDSSSGLYSSTTVTANTSLEHSSILATKDNPNAGHSILNTTTTVIVTCTSGSEVSSLTTTQNTSPLVSTVDPPIVYVTTYTTTTIPFYTTVVTIVHATRRLFD